MTVKTTGMVNVFLPIMVKGEEILREQIALYSGYLYDVEILDNCMYRGINSFGRVVLINIEDAKEVKR